MIYQIRLVNKEEILAEYIGEDDQQIVVQNPLITVHVANVEILVPYMMYSREALVGLMKQHIVCIAPVLDDVNDYYYNSLGYASPMYQANLMTRIKAVNATYQKHLAKDNLSFETEVAKKTNVYDNDVLVSNTAH